MPVRVDEVENCCMTERRERVGARVGPRLGPDDGAVETAAVVEKPEPLTKEQRLERKRPAKAEKSKEMLAGSVLEQKAA